MIIRNATLDDVTALAILGQEIQKIHYEQRPKWFKHVGSRELVSFYREFLTGNDHVGFIAEYDSVPVGFALFRVLHRENTVITHPLLTVNVDQIGVSESARRMGIGRKILGAIREFAVDIGADQIHIDSWNFNKNAREFFESAGFSTEIRRFHLDLTN